MENPPTTTKPTFEEVNQSLLALEAEHRPADVVLDGTPIWDHLRFTVFRSVANAALGWGQIHSNVDDRLRLYANRATLLARNVVHRNPFLADRHDVLFWGHPRRKRLADGFWWDVYCDPITDELPLDYLHLEPPSVDRHLSPAKTASLRYLDAIEILGEVGELVGPTLDRPRVDAFADLSRAIRETFDVDLDVDELARDRLARRRIVRPLYRRLLERVDPELAVVVVSYAGKELFIEVCRELGVPVAELQHGIVDEFHSAYHYPGGRSKSLFPDYLLTFGEFWGEQVSLPIPARDVVPIGYRHLERSKEQYAGVRRRDQVVFVSSGAYAESLSKMAVALHDDPSCRSSVAYKLHPGEVDRWRETYPWLADSGVTVVSDAHTELHRLFAESTAQVGVYSTALYEGLHFGLETYLVDMPELPLPAGISEQGNATVVRSPEELVASFGTGVPPSDTTVFFADESRRRVRATFERLLD